MKYIIGVDLAKKDDHSVFCLMKIDSIGVTIIQFEKKPLKDEDDENSFKRQVAALAKKYNARVV
jgi:thiamine monophosphate synthase